MSEKETMSKQHLLHRTVSGIALVIVLISVGSLFFVDNNIQPDKLAEITPINIIEVVRDESVTKQIDPKPAEQERDGEDTIPINVPPDTIHTEYVSESVENGVIITKEGKEFPIQQYSTLALPNDPGANQWWVADSNLESAWDTGVGSTPVVVAVLDTGFDLDHEEFTNRWFTNSGESGVTSSENASDLNCTDQFVALDKSCNNIDDNFDGIMDNESGTTTQENPSRLNCTDQFVALDKSCNLIDDDSNGLIDDVRGWDFGYYDQNVEAGEVNPTGEGTTHGTKVAGIVGANANNNVGIAGVNWSAKILPIQVFTDDSYADTITVSRAIRYAADMGADVINLSLGSWYNDPYMRSAVSDAIAAGSLVVASSGNDGCSNCILYPANYPEVLAVGSFSSGKNISSFTSYGPNLDLLAPGSSMTSPTWSNSNNSSYATVSGTSFSAPFVSGLIALAKSHQPYASWTEVIAAMLENADKSVLSTTHSDTYGFGLVDAGAALDRVTLPRSEPYEVRYATLSNTNQLGSILAYQCTDSSVGSTSMYQLVKSGLYKYTVNEHERWTLKTTGWSDLFIGHVCVGLPDDDITEVRSLNLINELANKTIKSLSN